MSASKSNMSTKMSNSSDNKNKTLVHEAKSHLTVMYGYIHLLKNTLESENVDKAKINELLDKTINSCNELEKTIQGIE